MLTFGLTLRLDGNDWADNTDPVVEGFAVIRLFFPSLTYTKFGKIATMKHFLT